MAISNEEYHRRVASLTLQSTPPLQPNPVISIFPNDNIDFGRERVEDAFHFRDCTISKHHLRFRCVVYDDDESEIPVSPMVYVQVLSSKAVSLVRAGAESDCHLLRRGVEDVLLNHGDVLKLTATLSILFQHEVTSAEEGQFTDVEVAEIRGFSDQYNVFNRVLGLGGQATVFLAAEQATGRQVACKIIRLPEAVFNEDRRLNWKERMDVFRREKQERQRQLESLKGAIDILKNLAHPNIISLEKAIFTPNNVYIFEELITGGDLQSYVQRTGFLTEPNAVVIVRQLLKAVEYLHDHDIAHRDIKPENILTTSWRNGARIVLTDFAQSKTLIDSKSKIENTRSHRMHTIVGTEGYAAPEVLARRHDAQGSGYSKAIDIWSIGCITASLLTGYMLFSANEQNSSTEKVEWDLAIMDHGREWTNIGCTAKSFIRGCVTVDESQRLTAKQALMHKWFTNKHYADEMEAAYQRAIQDWEPRPKRDPLVEAMDMSNARSAAANVGQASHYAKEVTSKFFDHPPRPTPVIPGVLRHHAGMTIQYRKPSALPSVTQDVEIDKIDNAAGLSFTQMQELEPDLTQFFKTAQQSSGETGLDNDSQLSIEDFAPPKTQVGSNLNQSGRHKANENHQTDKNHSGVASNIKNDVQSSFTPINSHASFMALVHLQ